MMLPGRRIIVTGGAHGIGRGIAQRCFLEGAHIAVLDNDVAAADEFIGTLTEIDRVHCAAGGEHRDALSIAVDLRDPDQIRHTVDVVRSRWECVDGIVNNAAVRISGKLDTLTVADWTDALLVNVRSAALLIQFALPMLLRSPSPSVVNIGSSVVDNPIPHLAPYTTAKAALHGLTSALAVECAPDGIRFNCVSPGTIGTRWVNELVENATDPKALLERLKARHLLARLGTPEDVASVTVFLLSDQAAFVTGACYRVDGGFSINGGFLRE